MKKIDNNKIKVVFILVIFFILFSSGMKAQESDAILKPEREFKNTIRFNITNPIIFGNKSIIFGYERVLKNNQTFSINIGQTGFPTLNIINSEELKANTILSERGFHISGDYRFYLSKLNKYNAPRGVYIGPYYGYNAFEKGHSWSFKSNNSGFEGDVDTELKLKIQTVGVELGYQFVFWNRFTVDMILLGPGVGNYNLKANVGSNLSDEDRKLFFEKLNEALKDKFPGYSGTIGNNSGEFETKGTKSATSLGYRYMIQIGYRF